MHLSFIAPLNGQLQLFSPPLLAEVVTVGMAGLELMVELMLV